MQKLRCYNYVRGNTTYSATYHNFFSPSDPHNFLQTTNPPLFPLIMNSDAYPDDNAIRQAGPNFLDCTLAQAGFYAKGCVCIEVWAFSAKKQRLDRVSLWVDPSFQRHHEASPSMAKLFDEASPDYVATQELAPGVGLAGILWADLEDHQSQKAIKHSISDSMGMSRSHNATPRLTFRLFGAGPDTRHGWGSRHGRDFFIPNENRGLPFQMEPHDTPSSREENGTPSSRPVQWRNVDALAGNPDQAFDERLALTSEVGIKFAAAVPFHIGGHEGIVLYLKTSKMEEHVRPTQELYLRRAADWIGSAYALQGPLETWMPHVDKQVYSPKELDSTEVESEASVVLHPIADSDDNAPINCLRQAANKFQESAVKWKGANVKPPPAMGWEEAGLAAIGAFTALIMVTSLSTSLPDQGLVLGSFGAFTTLLFGLSSAPASQPRAAVLGQIVSGLIALAIGALTPLPVFVRQSLATALSIGAMAKLGITHPPAGGAAIILSNGKWSPRTLPYMLGGVLVAVSTATLFNNLSPKRQYPTAWGIQQSFEQLKAYFPTRTKGPSPSSPPLEGTAMAGTEDTKDMIHSDDETADFDLEIDC